MSASNSAQAITIRSVLKGFPKNLLETLSTSALEASVHRVTQDSREAAPGAIFVAVKGEKQDGHDFITQVDASKPALIVGEKPAPAGLASPYLQVTSSRLALARLAANFHANPAHQMIVVGVTGTSGKTTTTYLIESILKAAGHKVGVIGTVSFRFGEKIYPSTHTTPGAPELQGLLAQMRADGVTAVVMEVSSHALKQHRVAFIPFDVSVFSNLSPEHLDFHQDMEDYFQSKAILFKGSAHFARDAGKSPAAVINADDSYGERLRRDIDRPGAPIRTLAVSLADDDLKIDLEGIRGEINGVQVRSSLTGRFNAYNIVCALAAGLALKIPAQTIARGIADLKAVPGRLERVPNSKGTHVLVDYAHKPDALEKVLKTLKEVRGNHRLVTVFGCGGDRDRTKRPVMGKLAVDHSDQVFVTSDNPRTEDPGSIIEEIVRGIPPESRNFTVEPDREKAIAKAVSQAKAGDIVLIAGKGHEDYQILRDPSDPKKTVKIHFDDREVAAKYLLTPIFEKF
jgi:UDP-N-acetylmuramoyl-L-alanyl-D-glutamate--2,6-diaminopimelate ligase